MEAVGVAIAVNAGAALVYSARVMDAYETISEQSKTNVHLNSDKDVQIIDPG